MADEEYPPPLGRVLDEIDKANTAVDTAVGMCIARHDPASAERLIRIEAELDDAAWWLTSVGS